MQWMIAGLINLVLQFLEASFQRDLPSSSTSSTSEDGRHNCSRRLQDAYAFMELTPPVSEEQLKKQYKKLSLRYHPDRNGGSQDATVQFQKLRECRDCIDKELAGVFDAEQEEEQEEPSSPPEDYEATGDDLYDFIQKRQAAQRKYRQMQQAAEQARQEEFQRQEERRNAFHSQTEPERQRCQQQRLEKGLETQSGREAAYQKFQQQANETVTQSSLGATTKTTPKPKYNIMEYNTNDMVMALRWNMPEVVFELMNQHLPTFAQTKGHQLAQRGIPVTAKRLKMEFMRHSLDEDDNNLLHYAIYYESYQIITMICTSALADGYLDSILHRPNRHGTTPLFFAQLAHDRSIRSLVQNQFILNDQYLANTKVLSALQSAVQRLGALQWGIVTTFDTLLSFWVAWRRFGMHPLFSFAALVWTHIIHTESLYRDEIPGVHRYCAHMAFCGVWWGTTTTTTTILLERRWNAWAMAVLLTPVLAVVVLVRQVASSLDLDTTMSDALLLAPIWFPAKVGDQLERIVILNQQLILPRLVLEKDLARSYLLLVTAVLPWSVEQVMALRS